MRLTLIRILKGIGILLAIAVTLGLMAVAAIYFMAEEKINKNYEVSVEPVSIPTDEAAIERGKKLVDTIGFCDECHNKDYSGQVFDEDPMIGILAVSNITRGEGGIGPDYGDEDWIRAIRYGVGRDGKALIDMPSHVYNKFSDADLGAIIAYVKSVPLVDNVLPGTRFGPLGRIFLLQDPSLLPAQVIDHDAPRPADPIPGVTVEYGRYLSSTCAICHGEDMAGGRAVGAGANITPGGDVGSWSEADFIRAMRTGLKPGGEALDPLMMPWERISKMTDDELKAIWLYLQSLPPVESEPVVEAGN